MEKKERLNIYIPTRVKRRLKAIADDKDMKMNDLVVTAISDMIDRMDMEHSAPDLVLDRMSQVLTSQMAIITSLNELNRKVESMSEEDE